MAKSMNHSRHWAYIAETGTTVGMGILIFAYRIGGHRLFKICLFPVICFYFLFRSDSRRASSDYLARIKSRVPDFPSVSWRLSFAHFWQFALMLIDKFAIWMEKIQPEDVVMHNIELVDQLVASKKGGIFAISHLGNFEICNALSERHRGVKLTVLHHTRHAEKFNRMLEKYTSKSNVKMMQVTELDAALAMQLSEKVGDGEFVAIAADRTPVNNPRATIACNFFGELADFPKGPYVLASVLSVPILLLICIKQQGIYHIYFEKLSDGGKVARRDRETFTRDTAEKFVSRLEYYTAQEPLQWFNFYDFWLRQKEDSLR
jgi:predicted LPLAT superfamily acyltransferase